jgi:hypothetical protein
MIKSYVLLIYSNNSLSLLSQFVARVIIIPEISGNYYGKRYLFTECLSFVRCKIIFLEVKNSRLAYLLR